MTCCVDLMLCCFLYLFVVNMFCFVFCVIPHFCLRPYQPHSYFAEILKTPLFSPLTSCIPPPPPRKREGTLHAVSCCNGGRQEGSAAHLQGDAVHSAGYAREGQANSAAKGFHRGRDPSCEPHQIRAPRGRYVFRRAGENLV